ISRSIVDKLLRHITFSVELPAKIAGQPKGTYVFFMLQVITVHKTVESAISQQVSYTGGVRTGIDGYTNIRHDAASAINDLAFIGPEFLFVCYFIRISI